MTITFYQIVAMNLIFTAFVILTIAEYEVYSCHCDFLSLSSAPPFSLHHPCNRQGSSPAQQDTIELIGCIPVQTRIITDVFLKSDKLNMTKAAVHFFESLSWDTFRFSSINHRPMRWDTSACWFSPRDLPAVAANIQHPMGQLVRSTQLLSRQSAQHAQIKCFTCLPVGRLESCP